MPTFTPTYRRESPDGVFGLGETPSEVGCFTELVRSRPGAHRTVDPIHSFAALGARAEDFVLWDTRKSCDALSEVIVGEPERVYSVEGD